MYKLQRFLAAEDKARLVVLQLRGVVDRIARGQLAQLGPRYPMYRRSLRAVAESPYPLDIYRGLLAAVKERVPDVVRPLTQVTARTKPAIVLRHDIDQTDCVANIENMAEIERDAGFRSSCYFRMDGLPYEPVLAREVAHNLKVEGFDVGIHSTAYIYEDPFEGFATEYDTFVDNFGFEPDSYTFHGFAHEENLARRIAFNFRAPEVLAHYPSLKATDCASGFYDYRIQDCHGRGKTRKILTDFSEPPLGFVEPPRTARLLVLTHPCHWQSR